MSESRTDDEGETGCSCCSIDAREENSAEGNTARIITDGSAVDAQLPRHVQVRLGRILGTDPVETLAAWADELQQRLDGGSIEVEDLCHADEETGHVGKLDEETYHFLCFYDAVVLSAMVDEPVDIRTESPDGGVIEARAVGTSELTVEPEDAVFSFGIADDVEPPSGDGLTPADVYGAVCPYVKAFPDGDAYEEWAETVPAATVAMALDGATEFAAVLVE